MPTASGLVQPTVSVEVVQVIGRVGVVPVRERTALDGVDLVGIDTDTLYVRTDADVDLHELVVDVDEDVPEGGVTTRSVRDGSVRYLAGERDSVLDATLARLSDDL